MKYDEVLAEPGVDYGDGRGRTVIARHSRRYCRRNSTGISAMAILGDGESVAVHGGDQASRFLLVAGRRLDEPIARGGPFVMNTNEEIQQAIADYQSGNF